MADRTDRGGVHARAETWSRLGGAVVAPAAPAPLAYPTGAAHRAEPAPAHGRAGRPPTGVAVPPRGAVGNPDRCRPAGRVDAVLAGGDDRRQRAGFSPDLPVVRREPTTGVLLRGGGGLRQGPPVGGPRPGRLLLLALRPGPPLVPPQRAAEPTCIDDCPFRLCPLPPKGDELPYQMDEVFCAHQVDLVGSWFRSPAPATWQAVNRDDLRTFWREMSERMAPAWRK